MTALPMSCNVRFKHVQLQFYCLKVLQFHDLKLFNDSTISISHPYINTTIAEGFTSSHLPYRILRLCRRCSAVCKIHLKAPVPDVVSLEPASQDMCQLTKYDKSFPSSASNHTQTVLLSAHLVPDRWKNLPTQKHQIVRCRQLAQGCDEDQNILRVRMAQEVRSEPNLHTSWRQLRMPNHQTTKTYKNHVFFF